MLGGGRAGAAFPAARFQRKKILHRGGNGGRFGRGGEQYCASFA
jgi:hypothetical protein